VYMGLKTGFVESGQLTASILGFFLLSSSTRASGRPFSIWENNIAQTTAASMAAMPGAAGLLGSLPALVLLGFHYSAWGLAAWGLVLGLLGLGIGLMLKRKLLDDEALPFPTGIATAELIRAMHASGQKALRRSRSLLMVGLGAMAAVWLRDGRPAVIPQASFLPFRVAGLPARTFTLGISWSPLMLGLGAIIGLRAGLSLAFGSLASWGIIAPRLFASGIVTQSRYSAFAGWLAFPGVALILGAAAISLFDDARQLPRALVDLWSSKPLTPTLSKRERGWTTLIAAGSGSAVVALLGWWIFKVNPLIVLLAVLLSVALGSVCARAAGQTDIAPLGKMGRITQFLFGALSPGNTAVNTVAGSVVAGDAAQTVSTLRAFRAGQVLGATPQHQTWAQAIGVLVGTLVALPVYLLLVGTYGLGTGPLPAPSAQEWKAVAEVVAAGPKAFPPHALSAALIGFAIGAVLSLLSRRQWRFLPAPAAVGIGFLVPSHYAVSICLGSLLLAFAQKARPQFASQDAPAMAAGAIAGESLMGVLVALLIATGLLQGP
jgi:uncharacterized oligopeptide transporter (OPT) family protein